LRARFIRSAVRFSGLLLVGSIAWAAEKLRFITRHDRDVRIGKVLARTFTQLAGVYIKFGQILAMRPDILPDEIVAPLEGLFDRVEPEPFDASRQTLIEVFGRDPLSIFAVLDSTPIAAASFATVYRAELKAGTVVAVKVQRRDVGQIVRQDLRILFALARIIDLTGFLKRFRLASFVAEFAQWTQEELDYQREARHMEYLRQGRLGHSIVEIPEVHWHLTGRRVLTMEYFDGVWLTDEAGVQRFSMDDRIEFASQFFDSFMHDIFELGFFHADPHPGNVCILPSGKIGMIDFGIIGFASELTRRSQSELLWAIQRNDLTAAFESILRVLNVPPDADLDGFQTAFEENVRNWRLLRYQPNVPAWERSGGRLLLANFQAARGSGLTFRAAAARYYRAFILLDAIVTMIDPQFDQIAALSRYFRQRFLRSRVETGLALLSSFDLQMIAAARGERLLSGLERIIATSAGDLITSAVDQTMQRISRVLRGFAYLALGALVLLIPASAFKEISPDKLGSLQETGRPLTRIIAGLVLDYDVIAITVAVIATAIITGWLARMFWINAYRGEQFSPTLLVREQRTGPIRTTPR
jgi:ubiquinone biosynthesis protein